MTQPDPGRLRAGHADRERAVDVLRAAFAEGRLDQDEYTDRVGLVHASRTYAALGALVADLPVGPLGTLARAPLAVAPPAQLPAAPPPAAPPPAVRGRAAKPRRSMSPLEIAAITLVVLTFPTIAIPVATVSFCVGVSQANPGHRTSMRLAAAAILVVVLGGLALYFHY
jgi:Domain of unknown function (DUF1707)